MQLVAFERLPELSQDDARAAFLVFRGVAETLVADAAPLRAAKRASPGLLATARAALSAAPRNADEARAFFAANFEPRAIGEGFLTGYYEPWVEGALARSTAFAAPLLARPSDLGARSPYPTRAEIEAAARDPVVWLEDAVEAYLIQVQGSARVRLPDGSWRRLIYAGRNGQPTRRSGGCWWKPGEISRRRCRSRG